MVKLLAIKATSKDGAKLISTHCILNVSYLTVGLYNAEAFSLC